MAADGETFGWLEVDRIGEALHAAHPKIDPLGVRFVELRRLVEALPAFKAVAGHPVNEKILEAVQMAWLDEREDAVDDDDDDE
jgi:FeS assembly protein IscX